MQTPDYVADANRPNPLSQVQDVVLQLQLALPAGQAQDRVRGSKLPMSAPR